MNDAKEQVIAFIRSLPDDCSIEDIRYHLYTYSRAEEGVRAFEAGLTGASGGGGGYHGGGGPRRPPGQDLTEKLILAWADAHRAREGEWPTTVSGDVAREPGETWRNVSQ